MRPAIEDRAAALDQLLSELQDGNAWDSTISLLADYADLVRDLMQDRLAVRADERAKVVAEIVAAWQPMETAPKDGTIVQLFDPVAEPPVSVGCWDEQAGMDGRPGWLIAEADFMPSLCRPRCWAPLLPRPDIAPTANAESAMTSDIVALIVAELRDLDGQRDESNLLGWAANHIEAKFGGPGYG